MSSTDEARDSVIKFSDHARSHFTATETDRARDIYEREMARRFDKLDLDDPGGDDPATCEMAWAAARRMIRDHCETFGLDHRPLMNSMNDIRPNGGLLNTDGIAPDQAATIRAFRRELVGDAFRANTRYCHTRADAGPAEAEGQPAGRKNALVFVALACEVLDRFAMGRDDDPSGCPLATMERLADHWLTCEQETRDE